MTDPIYYSRPEVARMLGISQRSADHLMQTGRLRSSKLGRRRVVHIEALKNFAGVERTLPELKSRHGSEPKHLRAEVYPALSLGTSALFSLCNKT
jgi:Helix-turn-helix domain